MNKTASFLEHWEEHWRSDMGGWFPGERVVLRGKDVFSELGEQPWMSFLIFTITGKLPSNQERKMFEGIWTITASYPDPRLWNNRIAALAGTARSTPALGLSGGIAVSEAIIYGFRPVLATIQFLQNTLQQQAQGLSLESILNTELNQEKEGRPGSGKNRQMAKIPGYGRPLVASDERIKPLKALAKKLGFDQGPHFLLAQEIEIKLQEMGHNYCMNITPLSCGFCSDAGLTPRQGYHYMLQCFNVGIVACGLDAEQKPEGAFFPLRCDRINYQGTPQRPWKEITTKMEAVAL